MTPGHALRLDPRIAEPSRYTLQVGELRQSGTIDPGASILAQLPAAQNTGELSIWPARFASPEEAGDQATVWELDICDLPPVDSAEGAQVRLNNLGYQCGACDGDLGPLTRSALLSFQEHESARATGELDADTQGALECSHGA